MRKIAEFVLIVAAASGLTIVADWVLTSPRARPIAPLDAGVDPSPMMARARDLPRQHIIDFSVGLQ
jgi:hypothetical protein